MGAILGGVIGGVGSLIGGKKAAKQDLTGFNYLKGSPVGQQYVPTGGQANAAEQDLLLGGGEKFGNAFQRYQDSTGTKFQLQEGQNAITSSAAARGNLNSGATLKALIKYGQNLGSTTFNNYLNQLGGLSTQGLQAAGTIGSAGTAGGQAAGEHQQSGITNAFGQFGGVAKSLFD